MSNAQTVIVVAGAQGNLGKLVCEALLARARLAGQDLLVRGLVRKGRSAASASTSDTADPRLVIEPVDYASDDDIGRVCAGATCVVSTLQGLEEVIIGVQSRLLKAAIAHNVRRFIPSDFSGDFTKLPQGSHRNFDLRRKFHQAADAIMRQSQAKIEFTSIFQGGFTELLGSGWVLFDYKKRQVGYFGAPDTVMEYTTWQNTAEFAAAAALDPTPTPRYLFIAGQRMSPREAQQIAKQVTGVDFALKRVMPTWLLGGMIKLLKRFKPGQPDEVMPLWVAMQYGYCGALGLMSPARLDNDRYGGIQWTGVNAVIRQAFDEAQVSRARE